ncbi:MAG: peptidase M14 [Acidobacteria bacterium]|nr:MAG: peptidase M14 [Acidobacteriota bacterium]REK02368.1 MAG: peptidase M14 [Acidobacteriota bacterium]REK13830.1 MAG: peptidase M14 [Acidobacteriota bacterium]REK41825.1 MAG: peptidase M14 [Acidobacteriota bacterium]
MKRIHALCFGLLLCFAAIGFGQDNFEFWPGTQYDPSVPTTKQVLGFEPGERIASHSELMKYFEALERAKPGRIKLFEYARTWEGKKLIYAAVGSEENIARLDSISDSMKRLADPRVTSDSDSRQIIANTPALTWLAYGVHGNEISSPDAAMVTAYHLLAATGNDVVDKILADSVVFIDPTQNPDGRDRFVHNFNVAEGLEPQESPLAAEHNEPWPGGRTNHYFFDMNRDWISLTQPETEGRIKALQEWWPVVVVDLHEMGTNSTYYFGPEAVPYNPFKTEQQHRNTDLYGKNNAKWFDRFGFDYYTREIFDGLYPGYGDSWPMLYGAVGMTYEQASVRGLIVRKSNGKLMHFRESVRHHFVASISTAETTAVNRERLLSDFYQHGKEEVEAGRTGSVRSFILPRTGDASLVDKLANLLYKQGVEVGQTSSAGTVCGTSYPAGSYGISTAQPARKLIRNLLDDDVPMDPEFIKVQEERRARGLPDEIYDITAWSLPIMFNVKAVPCGQALPGSFQNVAPQAVTPGSVSGGAASVGYLVPWGSSAAAKLVTGALKKGLSVFSADQVFLQNGRTYPRGTLIIKNADNPSGLGATLSELARTTGAEVVSTNSSWVESGINFGSDNVVAIKRPRVAIAWDEPTSSYSAGQTRFILERQYGFPVTPVRTSQLGSRDIAQFDVIILPDGFGYSRVLGGGGVSRLKDWVAGGGTLIGLGSGAVSFLADPGTGMLAISRENAVKTDKDGKPVAGEKPSEPAARVPGKLITSEDQFKDMIDANVSSPDSVAGVLVRAKTDRNHWVTAGVEETVNAIFRGNAIFTPIDLDNGINAAYFAGPDDLLAGGYMWEETRKQLAFKPFVVVQPSGRGNVVGFTQDPTIRAYLDGLNVMLLNAIFRRSAQAVSYGGER